MKNSFVIVIAFYFLLSSFNSEAQKSIEVKDGDGNLIQIKITISPYARFTVKSGQAALGVDNFFSSK